MPSFAGPSDGAQWTRARCSSTSRRLKGAAGSSIWRPFLPGLGVRGPGLNVERTAQTLTADDRDLAGSGRDGLLDGAVRSLGEAAGGVTVDGLLARPGPAAEPGLP